MLTEKKKRFAKEYIVDANATAAAKRAGYSAKTAYSLGQRLLRDVDVRACMDELMAAHESQLVADSDEVLKYLTAVMRGQSKATVVVVESTGARTMEKLPDEREQLKAAELLGRRYGLFTDKVDVSGVAQVVFSGEGEIGD